MKIITKAIQKSTPSIGYYEQTKSPLKFHFKLFTPWTNWTWYIAECNFETGECFGLVDGHVKELGYFDLNEILEIKGKFGLKVERDLHFDAIMYDELIIKENRVI